MVERVEWQGNPLAIIIRKEFEPETTTFFTPKDYPLQLGIVKLDRGGVIKPHIHRRSEKIIHEVHEALHLQYGKIQVDFYSEEGEKAGSTILCEGDTILLIHGGHAIRALEKFKIIEVKQGPYGSLEGDKVFLEVKDDTCI